MTYTTSNLLSYLKENDVKISVKEGKLRINDVRKIITADLLQEIKSHKTAILDLYQHSTQQNGLLQTPIAKVVQQPDGYQLSNAQRRLWVLDQLEAGMVAYNLPGAMRVKGELNKTALQTAFQQLFERHEILRTRFVVGEDSIPKQVIEAANFQLFYQKWEQSETALKEYIFDFSNQKFDLSKGDLFKVELLELGVSEHILLLNMHHIISDGWSMGILWKELSELYEAAVQQNENPLLPLPIQYKDYAAWQANLLDKGGYLEEMRTYWMQQLADAPTLELPTDFVRPLQKSYEGAHLVHSFDKTTLSGLMQLSRQSGASLFMTLTALVKVLLYRYTQQEDLIVGTPIAGRNHPDLHDQIGFYINTLALRTQLNETQNFVQFLEKVKKTALNAFERDLYPFDQLVEDLEVERDQSRPPLFDVMVALQNNEHSELQLGDTKMEGVLNSFPVSKFDITFSFTEWKEGQLELIVEYSTKLFKAERMERMVTHLNCLINSVLQDATQAVNRLNILPKAERKLVLNDFNDTKADYPQDQTLVSLFEKQVAKTPNEIAVVFGNKELTYQQLNEKANELSHFLRANYTIKADDIIALQLERSEWMIIAIFGVLKSGAAYLPIGTDLPKTRVAFILKDSKAKTLLTDTTTFENAPHLDIDVENIESINYDAHRQPFTVNRQPSDLAYIIYTSGSTGQPKGVMIEHRSIINRLNWMQRAYPIGTGDCILQKTPYTFDVSVWELLWWSLEGAKVALLKPGGEKEPDTILNAIAEYEVSTMHFVPSMLDGFLLHLEQNPASHQTQSLRQVFMSGEALSTLQVQQFFARIGNPNTALHNLYGPTEASIDVTYFDCRLLGTATTVPIGKAIDNTQLYILDAQYQPVPVGVAGELCIGGAGLARGYLNNKTLTAEKFIPFPSTLGEAQNGERLYQTGDLAYWQADGNIEFLGRKDHQLKIRGYRIEAGEIEHKLLQQTDLQAAVVIGQKMGNTTELVAYVVPSEQGISSLETLRTALSLDLPDYMIPSYFVELEQLPLTSSGKVNRKALPAPDEQNLTTEHQYIAPRNTVEASLVNIWEEVLHRKGIGVLDNFFDLGGHSLRAIRVVTLIRQRLSANIPLNEIFARPTLKALAEKVQRQIATSPMLLEPIPVVETEESYPLSMAQRRLWIPDQIMKNMVAYNMPFACRLEGGLDKKALQQAFETLINRHEILRTRLITTADGTPRQLIDAPQTFQLTCKNWTNKSATDIQQYLDNDHAHHVFDLSRDSLLKVELLEVGEEAHLLLINMHHIISDGWSIGILFEELSKLYNAFVSQSTPNVPTLRIQYKDYCAWQDCLLSDEQHIANLRNYWQQQLTGFQLLELPTDFVRPAAQNFEGAYYNYQFSPAILNQLETISRAAGASLFMTLTALVKILLYRYTHQEDIVIGTGIAGRNHPDLYHQIGFYVNTLVLRNQLNGDDTFEQTLAKVKKTALQAFEHDSYPFDLMVEEMEVERDLSRNPIFDTFIILQNNENAELQWNEVNVTPIANEFKTSKFDLSFIFHSDEKGLNLTTEYSTQLFKTSRIERIVQQLGTLMESLERQPTQSIRQLNILPAAEQQLVLNDFNQTTTESPNQTIIELFEKQVIKSPQQTAIIFDNQELSYQELNQKANQLAHYLRREYQIQANDIIALQLERSEWMIISILAVLKSGAAYLPISPDFPQARVEHILQDSQAKALLTDAATVEELEILEVNLPILNVEKVSDTLKVSDTSHNPKIITTEKDLAYIIYTSGSTGQPKGVMIEHRNFVNFHQHYQLEQHICTLTCNYVFDVSVMEILTALLSASTLVIPPKEVTLDAERYADFLQQYRISHAYLHPFHLEAIGNRLAQYEEVFLKRLLIGVEPILENAIHWYKAQSVRIINGYGPSETTICSTMYEVPTAIGETNEKLPIGKPMQNTEILILDADGKLSPIGVAGELCIAGAGLGRGYLHQPTLTAEKFVPHPLKAGKRLYKTGDLAQWQEDGNIEFLGRKDYQLKIRGYRIEAGEIEQTLLQHPAVKIALVQGSKYQEESVLQAYFVPDVSALNASQQNQAQEEILSSWQEVFDSSYNDTEVNIEDLTFDISGWGNSYTNAPIPAEEMKQWAENTATRINALQPDKVFEIGVGTGMFLARIAPHVTQYIATDVSPYAVAKVNRMIEAYPELGHAQVASGAAHQLPNIAPQSLDMVIINSVAQYFPNQAYFTKVLLEAIEMLESGGHLFVGDIRNFALLRAFHAEVKLHQLLDSTSKAEFLTALNNGVGSDKELTVAPAYFYHLQQLTDRPLQIDIALKEDDYLNELSQYRYDITIKVEAKEQAFSANWQDWKKENWTLAQVEKYLKEQQNRVLTLKNIPNARVYQGTKAVAWVNGKIAATQVSSFKKKIQEEVADVLPEAFWNLVNDTDYRVKINWSADAHSGAYDVAILPKDFQQHIVFPIEQQEKNVIGKSIYCNFPMQNELQKRLVTELREHLSHQLPDYMIPQYFIPLDEMPLTASGKINRKALPELESLSLSSGENYLAPRTKTEATLVAIWEEVLQRTGIGIKENFFNLGGHSLRAIRVISLVHQQLDAKINLGEFFEQPTIEALAQIIQTRDSVLFEAIEPVTTQTVYELSNAQRRLWVLDQLEEGMTAYNMPANLRIKGKLNIDAFTKALQQVVQRHEILRTRFIVEADGTPKQVIETEIDFKLPFQKWTASEEALKEYANAFTNHTFNLSVGNLLKVELLQIAEEDHVLLFNIHHIISDGWSFGILFKELSQLYELFNKSNLTPDSSFLTPLKIQYKDYAAWQLNLLSDNDRMEEMRNYWTHQLADIPVLELPTDYQRPLIKSYEGKRLIHTFDSNILDRLNQLSQQTGASLFMTLTALTKVLLYRYTRQEDLTIGTLSAGRNHPDLHDQIGFYVNTLALRSQLDGAENFLQTLEKIKETALAAFEREWYPFDRLVEELRVARDQSRSPLFDVMVDLQNNEPLRLELGETQVAGFSSNFDISHYDLNFGFATDEKEGLHLVLSYSTALFTEDRMERMIQHLGQLINSVLQDASQSIGTLNLLPKAEKQLLLQDFKGTEVELPQPCTIIGQFERQVAETPDHIALVFENKTLTYQQLNERANQLGHYLRATYHIQIDDIIALQLERSEWMIVAMLGVMKAGAAYLPIATDMPLGRVEFMLEDSRAKALIRDTSTYDLPKPNLEIPILEIEKVSDTLKVSDTWSRSNPQSITTEKDLAYIIYTSGSTGQPKGVMVGHEGAVNFLLRPIEEFGVQPGDRVLQFSTYTFDTSVAEIYLALFAGAALVIPAHTQFSADEFVQFIQENKVTILDLPPKFLNVLNGANLGATRLLILGGEAPDAATLKYYTQNYRCYNSYGPTEASVSATMFEIPADWDKSYIPIGRPQYNTEVYILNEHQQLQPIGVSGELCISGVGVTRGYLNNEELTQEKFIEHSFQADEKLYRTGDLARWLPDGNLEFLGRVDRQLKIRGYRIEAGEIEQILLQNEAIQSAVVMGQQLGSSKELVAYLVANVQGMLNLETLRQNLSEQVPNYMIPSYFIELDELPLTRNGKVNYKTLPKPDNNNLQTKTDYVPPRNETEATLAAIWEEVLQRNSFGVHDNFFELGGHSLRAIRVVALIQQQLSAKVALTEIFAHPTVAEIAEKVKDYQDKQALQDILVPSNGDKENSQDIEKFEEAW